MSDILKPILITHRSLKEWCGGCPIFQTIGNRCEAPMLNRGWRTCPCRDCLIKTMCEEICDEMRKHKHEIVNKVRGKWKEKHGGVGEDG